MTTTPPSERPGKWYALHTWAGHEKRTQANLEARVKTMHMEHRVFEVCFPIEVVTVRRRGRPTMVQKRRFPGYLLVRMHVTPESWQFIMTSPGVNGHIGHGQPNEIDGREVDAMLSDPLAVANTEPKSLESGQAVRVVKGPYYDYAGTVAEVKESRVRVMLSIFGIETPVDLEFDDVKID